MGLRWNKKRPLHLPQRSHGILIQKRRSFRRLVPPISVIPIFVHVPIIYILNSLIPACLLNERNSFDLYDVLCIFLKTILLFLLTHVWLRVLKLHHLLLKISNRISMDPRHAALSMKLHLHSIRLSSIFTIYHHPLVPSTNVIR